MRAGPGVAFLLGGTALIGVDVGDAPAPVPGGGAIATEVVQADRVDLSAGDARFVEVRDLAVSERGVWVLDSAEPFLTLLTLDGRTVNRFGSEGQGPSELMNPLGIEVDPSGGTVRVWDMGNARLAEFDAAGSVLGTQPMGGTFMGTVRKNIRDVSYVDPFRVRRVGRDYVAARYPERASRTADFLSGTLVRTDPTLAELGPIVAFASEAVQMAATRVSLEFTAVPLWDACPGLVVTWLPERGTVRWVDVSGRLQHEVPVPVEPPPVTLDDVEAYLRRMARLELGPGWEEQIPNLRAMAREMRGQFALRAPVATEVRCGTDGSAWLRMFDTGASPLGLGHEWLRVETRGVVTRVSFPESFSPMVFTQDEAFGVWTDAETGLQRVAQWTARGSAQLAADQ